MEEYAIRVGTEKCPKSLLLQACLEMPVALKTHVVGIAQIRLRWLLYTMLKGLIRQERITAPHSKQSKRSNFARQVSFASWGNKHAGHAPTPCKCVQMPVLIVSWASSLDALGVLLLGRSLLLLGEQLIAHPGRRLLQLATQERLHSSIDT